MKNFRLIVAIPLALWADGAVTAQTRYLATPEPIKDASYAHPSGLAFPATVDAFHRVSLLRYDADRLDISAGYILTARPGGAAATVYVSPSPAAGEPCRGEFDAMKQAVVTAHA